MVYIMSSGPKRDFALISGPQKWAVWGRGGEGERRRVGEPEVPPGLRKEALEKRCRCDTLW